MATILIAEDERDLNNLVRRHLEEEGHRVLQVFDGPSAVQTAQQERPDAVILDWMLPRLDGLEVCRRIRRESIVPILMLTARSEEVDRILGLEVGADDYLTKPFSIRELLARVRALLRRVELMTDAGAREGSRRGGGGSGSASGPRDGQAARWSPEAEEAPPPALVAGPLRVDPGQHVASVEGRPLDLTPKEFDLLALLVRNPGRAFGRDYLLEKVWGYEYGGFDRTVDTHVLRLRKKLGPLGERIQTVWGIGYRFSAAPDGRPVAEG